MLTVEQAIEQRKSVRTFTQERPCESLLRETLAAAPLTVDEAAAGVALHLLPARAADGRRMGTYGVISGAPAYVAVSCPDQSAYAAMLAGIAGERAVLEFTRRGLATVWLGGTFSRADLRRLLPHLPAGHTVPAVIAVGYDAGRTRMLERVLRGVARSASRKPIEKLIISGSVPPALADALRAARLAPSAANRQPWRFAFRPDGSAHVFADTSDSFYALDTGIALAHFLALAPGLKLSPLTGQAPRGLKPIASLSTL